jgi:DNA-directed RNA polymerase specialized sigma24 family protein
MHSIAPHESPDLRGLTWQDLFTIRNAMASRQAKRWGGRLPYEEFLSAGNEALATICRDPDVPADRDGFLRWLRQEMRWAMAQVAYRAFGRDGRSGKAKPAPLTVPLAGAASRPAPVSVFAATYLTEVCTYLAAYPYPARLASFWLTVAGYSSAEIAARLQITIETVQHRNRNLRRDMGAWLGEPTAARQAPVAHD